MSHVAGPHVFDLVGAFAGWFGVSIALWLAWVTPREVPVEYVGSFFVVGSFLILLHAEAIPGLGADVVLSLRAVGLGTALAAELGAAYYVWKEAEVEDPRKTVGGLAHACRDLARAR